MVNKKFINQLSFIVALILSYYTSNCQIRDTFYMNHIFSEGAIIFTDTSFKMNVVGKGLQAYKNYLLNLEGKYQYFEEGRIKLVPEKISQRDRFSNGKKIPLKFSQISPPNTINTFFFIINYKKSKILLTPKNIIDIANLINETNSFIPIPDGVFCNFKNSEDLILDKSIKLNYPPKYRNHIVEKPIESNVLKVELVNRFNKEDYSTFLNKKIYLDKGENHGILPGMILYKHKDGVFTGCSLEITESISNQSSSFRNHSQKTEECLSGTYSTKKNKLSAFPTDEYVQLIRSAEYYLEKGFFTQALNDFRDAFLIYQKDEFDYYNAAIAATQLKKTKEAQSLLLKSIRNGYLDKYNLLNNPMLKELRNSEYWSSIPDAIDVTQQEFLSTFKEIKNVPFEALVPFVQDGKWGYISEKDLQIKVPAKFYGLSFGTKCLKIQISHHDNVLLFPDFSLRYYEPEYSEKSPNLPKIDSTMVNGGFTVENGKINSVSNIYDDYRKEIYNPIYTYFSTKYIIGPFKIDNKNYAIVKKNGRLAIVNENGIPLKGFDFNFKVLMKNKYYKGEDSWFYYLDFNHNQGFIKDSGEKRFVNIFSHYYTSFKSGFGPLYSRKFKRQDKPKFIIIDYENMSVVYENFNHTLITIDARYRNCLYNGEGDENRDNLDKLFFKVKDKDQNIIYIDRKGIEYKAGN